MLLLAGRTIGKTIRFLISLAKSLEEDPERAKRIARISLKMVLPEVAKRLIPNPTLRDFLAKAINWDFLLNLVLNWFFDKIVAELDLDKFLREILGEVQEFFLETSFRLAVTFAMHAAGVNVAVKQLGNDVYLLYLAGSKGKRIVLSFRF
ncbi:MAG: hypothetical protein RQ862_01835 [Candidatus Caldarchaeales archaeon]|nr:hypothetical protein [Candidatus Caldarchaeales archaeon]